MENGAQKIVEQIKNLVDELAAMSGEILIKKKTPRQRGGKVIPKGAMGALTLLTEDGFFDTPRDVATIMERLKEIGRYYPQSAVAMNLLNLTKRRTFNRLKDKGAKNWLYVLRK